MQRIKMINRQIVLLLHPAHPPRQFRIYWAHNSKLYQPDFVVETTHCIYLAETKAADQLHTPEVLDKKRAALTYCKHATRFTSRTGGKPWKYLLIPHDVVKTNMTLEWYENQYAEAIPEKR
jgi:type III restriction enzyme